MRGAGDRNARAHVVRISHGPLERLHPAKRAASHGEQTLDSQYVEQPSLRAYHVANGDHGEVEPVRLVRARVERPWAGRAAAAANQVRAHHVVAVSVEGFARPDHAVPPAKPAAWSDTAFVGADAIDCAGCVGIVAPARGVRVTAQ